MAKEWQDMATDGTGNTLPPSVEQLLWEYEDGSLDWESDRDLIIGRVLAEGAWEAVMWLRRQVTEAELADWLRRHRGRGLSRKQLRFWQTVLRLPEKEVDAWLSQPDRQIWDQRTRR